MKYNRLSKFLTNIVQLTLIVIALPFLENYFFLAPKKEQLNLWQKTKKADSLFVFIEKSMKTDENMEQKNILRLDTLLSIRSKIYQLLPNDINHINIARTYYYKGLLYLGLYNFKESKNNYQKALDIVRQSNDTTRIIKYSIAIANPKNELKEYSDSENLIENALQLMRNCDFEKKEKYYLYAWQRKAEIAKANQDNKTMFLMDSLCFQSRLKRKEEDISEFYDFSHNLGTDYASRKQYKMAFSLFEKAKFGFLNLYNIDKDKENLLKTANTITEIAHTHLELKNYPQAIKNYQNAFKILEETKVQKHPYTCEALIGIGNCYFEQKKYAAAFNAYDNAMKALVPDNNIEHAYAPKYYLAAALAKLKARKVLNPNDLQNILADCNYIDNLINSIQKQYSNDESKLNLTEESLSFYESAIETAANTYQQTQDPSCFNQALLFCERNKATILRQNLQEQNALQNAGLPDSLLQKERDLKIELAYYKKKSFDNQADTIAKNKITETQIRLNALIARFEKEFHKYYELKYDDKASNTIAEIQDKLPDNTMMIEYFMGDKNIYNFSISKQHTDIQILPMPSNFDSTFNDFRTTVEKDTNEEMKFCQASYQLYQWLMEKTLAKAPNTIKNLRIILDGQLGLLPFDILSVQLAKGWKHSDKPKWLLKDYAISYVYSNKLLFEDEKNNAIGNKKSVGFGINYKQIYNVTNTQNQHFDSLSYATEEVEKVMLAFDGKPFLNENATILNFKNEAPNSKVLYLAMHGILNEKDPLRSGLIFCNKEKYDTLYAHDIYDMQLRNELAVLSACNTGNGKLHRSEGIMSLGRAFAYAGTPSLVMSLWSISDQSTGKVMKFFQANLQKGMSKDEALQKAKIEYLDSTENANTRPNLWAASALVSPLRKESHWLRNVFIFLGLAAGLFLFALKTKK